ncbi:hypothetical protein [Pseudomonas sp. N040]|uniref:hypothetical protein n=1 Tax=Pseudomonas sp. N040 TaxID=2785325 RepID=UPI0018A2E6F5|nr:hypothetical protein [Pseudomonas sp. N040]MBF7728788.1 hypothetical protein [Pseudomonas sp. N040]MBW7012428.1 hypothetical protein [Pseudomonas sp. N040]
MNSFKNTFLAGLLGLALVSLAGCDAAEQSARDLASQAKQAAQELAQAKLRESVEALNEQVDKVQGKAEDWTKQPDTARDQPAEELKPLARDLPAGSLET